MKRVLGAIVIIAFGFLLTACPTNWGYPILDCIPVNCDVTPDHECCLNADAGEVGGTDTSGIDTGGGDTGGGDTSGGDCGPR